MYYLSVSALTYTHDVCVCIYIYIYIYIGLPGGTSGKEPACP